MKSKRISVLLVHEDSIVRRWLRAIFNAEEDIAIVAEAATCQEAVAVAAQIKPAVIVMDVVSPYYVEAKATRDILRAHRSARIVALSPNPDRIGMKVMIASGVAGYLVKDVSLADLLKAIRDVYRGNASFSPSVAIELRDWWRLSYGTRKRAGRPPGNLKGVAPSIPRNGSAHHQSEGGLPAVEPVQNVERPHNHSAAL
jgi:DNA-binding NarL/FixJ family response regulator